MSETITDTVDGVATEVAKGAVANAANPQWIVNMMMFIVFIAGGAYFIYRTVYIDKPQADANIQSVNASTEAIRSNAESIRKMGDAIVEINTHFRASSEKMTKAVDNLNEIEKSQDEALKKIVDKLTKSPNDRNGG